MEGRGDRNEEWVGINLEEEREIWWRRDGQQGVKEG